MHFLERFGESPGSLCSSHDDSFQCNCWSCSKKDFGRGRSITCTVTGGRHYSRESATRRPCILKFEGSVKEIAKGEKLIKSALSSTPSKNEPHMDGRGKGEDQHSR